MGGESRSISDTPYYIIKKQVVSNVSSLISVTRNLRSTDQVELLTCRKIYFNDHDKDICP